MTIQPTTKLAEAFCLGDVFVHIRQYGDGGEGGYTVLFAPGKVPMNTLTDAHGFDGLELEDLANAVDAARLMLAFLEKRDTLVEFAANVRRFPAPIEPDTD